MVEKLKQLSIKANLSVRLLLLTMAFVMLAEILIYIPSITNYRKAWLEEKLVAANIAVLAIEAAPDHMVSEMLTKRLLNSVQVQAISLKQEEKRHLMLNTEQPLEITARYDLRDASYGALIVDALKTLFHVASPHGSLIEVTGHTATAPHDAVDSIQIIFDESLLCEDMFAFSYNVLLLSIIISLITAGLVYYSLSCLLIRPVRKMTRSVMSFRAAPEVATEDLSAEGRQDEIGIIMRELGAMQEEVRRALIQKNHLAHLGESVSKINHDLRNILSSAQMVSDHLSTVNDPVVQKLTPRFVTALDRAIRLCESTLKYGRADTERPRVSTVHLQQTIAEVGLSLGCVDREDVRFRNEVAADFTVQADPDHLFRVFLNIARNALQAMEYKGEITFTARQRAGRKIIDIVDDGPGIPVRVRDNLFQPFRGSGNGGSGLGLAISKELLEAHGGGIELCRSDLSGTHFRITLPE